MYITYHAEGKIRKRLGIPKKAVARMVQSALDEGVDHSVFSGSFRHYLDKTINEEHCANNLRVYNQHLFLFHDDILITAWPLAQKYRKAATRATSDDHQIPSQTKYRSKNLEGSSWSPEEG